MATESPIHVTAAHNLSQSSRTEAAGLPNAKISSNLASGDVKATLNFYNPPADGSNPYFFVEPPKDGSPSRNYSDIDNEVTVRDIRGREAQYNLDNDAFLAIQNVPDSLEKDFADDESIEKNYYPEVEKLLLDNVPGTSRVFFFDHTIRRADPNARRNPVMRAHIDQTAVSAKARVERHLGADAEKLLQGRWRIINVWRPLNGTVESFPLAFASSQSVDNADVVPVEHRYPTTTGETAGIRHNENQKWHYWSGMTNNERVLLECFDSESLKAGTTVRGGRVPHTAFEHPKTPEGAKGRESIEVRALVFGP